MINGRQLCNNFMHSDHVMFFSEFVRRTHLINVMRTVRVQENIVIFGVTADCAFQCTGPVFVCAGFADPFSGAGSTATTTAAGPAAVSTAARVP